jgi:SAM-dependent methyltransferase
MAGHDEELATAFDARAAQFESRPAQSNPALLAWLVAVADLPPDSRVLDAGCGPGLVAGALLGAGHRVVGLDLSSVMVERARARCAGPGGRAAFLHQSVFDPLPGEYSGPFDACVSRFVLHHVADAGAFLRRQAELLRPGGVLVVCDHTTDPDSPAATWHEQIERARDRTHSCCLSPGVLVDALAAAGLHDIRLAERPLELDFDEWFDAGIPTAPKEAVRRQLLDSPGCRGFRPEPLPGGRVRLHLWVAAARGRRGPRP